MSKMPLSEAILLGLPEIEFCNTDWFVPARNNDGKCKGCIVGAALYSVGTDQYGAIKNMMTEWPWTQQLSHAPCPACGLVSTHPLSQSDEVYGLGHNFTHMARHYINKEITGEQIADWVRSIEPVEVESESIVGEEQCLTLPIY